MRNFIIKQFTLGNNSNICSVATVETSSAHIEAVAPWRPSTCWQYRHTVEVPKMAADKVSIVLVRRCPSIAALQEADNWGTHWPFSSALEDPD